MNSAADFLAAVEAYLQRSGESASAFGRRVLGDPTFVFDLRTGRSPSLRLVDRVMTALAQSSTKRKSA